MKCEICDKEAAFRWTDTHGLGACVYCGAPYTIYHYDSNRNRLDKPPECEISIEYKPLIKQYWLENHRNCCPGVGNFPGSSYEVATPEDFKIFSEWMERHTNPSLRTSEEYKA